MVEIIKVEEYLSRANEPKYPLDKVGTWRIMSGERTGSNWESLPRIELDLVSGRYIDAIGHALELDGIYCDMRKEKKEAGDIRAGYIEEVTVRGLPLNQDLDDLL